MAAGWSPFGSYSDTSSKWMPPSDLSGRCGRCGVHATPWRMLGSPATSRACRLSAVALAPVMPNGCAASAGALPRAAACDAILGGRSPGRRTSSPTTWSTAAPRPKGEHVGELARRCAKPARVVEGGLAVLEAGAGAGPTLSAGFSSAARCSPSGLTSGLAAFDLPVGLGLRGLSVLGLVSLGIRRIWRGGPAEGRNAVATEGR